MGVHWIANKKTVGAGKKPELRGYKSGMGENGCIETWNSSGAWRKPTERRPSRVAAAFKARGAACGDEKKELLHRLPPKFVCCILSEFNAGNLDSPSLGARLGNAKTRLYELRCA